jgi:hypothetical protein
MRKKKESEYHTGRLNISCPPSMKDRIAEDATAQGLSISQFILQLYDKSTQAGSSEHLARMGLDMVGLKKRLVDIDTHLRRSLSRSQGTVDPQVREDLMKLQEVEAEIDVALRECVSAVKQLKEQGK